MRSFLAICLVGWAANPGLVWAQSQVTVTGVLHKLDVKTGTITLYVTKAGAREEKTFSLLRPDTEVVAREGLVRLSDLAAGNVVHLRLTDAQDVDAIRVDTPVIRGALTAIDLARPSISVLTEDLARKTFSASGKTKVVRQKTTLRLDELRVNEWVEIAFSIDGKDARSIEVHAPGSQNGRVSSGKLQGTIVLLDRAIGTLLFHQDNGKARLMSFAAPRDLSPALVFERRLLETLDESQAIASRSATLYLSPDHKEVRRILVDAPLLRCRILAVELDRRRLIVEDGGTKATWELPVDAKVLIGRRYGRLADLRADASVDLVLSLDRAKLRAIVLAKGQ